MFESASQLSTERLQRVRAILQLISELESTDPMRPDSEQVLALRGLFFVMLYGYFEHSVSDRVRILTIHLADLRVPTAHLSGRIRSIIAHSRFQEIEDSGVTVPRWKKRIRLLDFLDSTDVQPIDESVFSSSMQNIRYATLDLIFEAFGISAPPTPNPGWRGYIDELVEKRNAVAHGRQCATEVGHSFRSGELVKRVEVIAGLVSHLEHVFREFAEGRSFIVGTHRARYTGGVPPT